MAARRRETCDQTEHLLRVLGHVTDDTPPALLHWLGWLLNTGRLVTMGAAEIERQSRAPQLEVRPPDRLAPLHCWEVLATRQESFLCIFRFFLDIVIMSKLNEVVVDAYFSHTFHR